MELKYLIVAAAVLVAALMVDEVKAGRGGSGRGRGQGRRRSRGSRGTRYEWTRDLGSGRAAKEDGFQPTGKNQVVLKSSDDNLSGANITKSTTLYDFTAATPVVAITTVGFGRHNPCFIINTTLTFDSIISTLAARNGTTVSNALPQVSVYGTSAQLSRDEARSFLDTNPSLRKACKGAKIVRTTETVAASTEEPTEVIKVIILDAEVSITIPQRSQRAGHGNNRNRDGRRGRGGRVGFSTY